MTDQENCGCRILGPAYDFRIAAIQYCDTHARAFKYREALEKITQVSQFGRDGGPIVSSEHYEACWLDCDEIAKEALK